jgi:hypothetical protein
MKQSVRLLRKGKECLVARQASDEIRECFSRIDYPNAM